MCFSLSSEYLIDGLGVIIHRDSYFVGVVSILKIIREYPLFTTLILEGETSQSVWIAYFGDCDRLFRDNPITSVSHL